LACWPIYCTYTFTRRFDWIYVITTLVALLGGLTTALRLIAPLLIDIILYLKKKQSSQLQQNQSKSEKKNF
jgi:hypothetical protein